MPDKGKARMAEGTGAADEATARTLLGIVGAWRASVARRATAIASDRHPSARLAAGHLNSLARMRSPPGSILYSPVYLLFHLLTCTTTPFMVSQMARQKRLQDLAAALDEMAVEEIADAWDFDAENQAARERPLSAGGRRWAGPRLLSSSRMPGSIRHLSSSSRSPTSLVLASEPSWSFPDLARSFAVESALVASSSRSLDSPASSTDSDDASLSQARMSIEAEIHRLSGRIVEFAELSGELQSSVTRLTTLLGSLAADSPNLQGSFDAGFFALRRAYRLERRSAESQAQLASENDLARAWRGKAAAWQVDRWRTGLGSHRHGASSFFAALYSPGLGTRHVATTDLKAAGRNPAFAGRLPKCECLRSLPTATATPWPVELLLLLRDRGASVPALSWLRAVDLALAEKQWDLAAEMMARPPSGSELVEGEGLLFRVPGPFSGRCLRQEQELATGLMSGQAGEGVRIAAEHALGKLEADQAVAARWLSVFSRFSAGSRTCAKVLSTAIASADSTYRTVNEDERHRIYLRLLDVLVRQGSFPAFQAFAAKPPAGLHRRRTDLLAVLLRAAARFEAETEGESIARMLAAQVSAAVGKPSVSLASPDVPPLILSSVLDFAFRPSASNRQFEAFIYSLFPAAFEPSPTRRYGKRVVERRNLPTLPQDPRLWTSILQHLARRGCHDLGAKVWRLVKAARVEDGPRPSWDLPIQGYTALVTLSGAALESRDASHISDRIFDRYRSVVARRNGSSEGPKTRAWIVGWHVFDLVKTQILHTLSRMTPAQRIDATVRPDDPFFEAVARVMLDAADMDLSARRANLPRLDSIITALAELGIPAPAHVVREVEEAKLATEARTCTPWIRSDGQRMRPKRRRFRNRSGFRGPSVASSGQAHEAGGVEQDLTRLKRRALELDRHCA